MNALLIFTRIICVEGIDFTSLNSVFDYYIVQYTTDLNECTKETRIGGTITEASMVSGPNVSLVNSTKY